MKQRLILLVLILSGKALFAQSNTIVQQAYIKVIEDGVSTAPDFVVITANNVKTGKTKEICLEVSQLFWSSMEEMPKKTDTELKQFLLSKAADRVFNFSNADALKRINFDNYNIKNEELIASIIVRNHLRDSLTKLIRFEKTSLADYDYYYEKRVSILKTLADSIEAIKPLSNEESKMLADLRDKYYDEYYSKPAYDKYRVMSEQGKALMKTWMSKIHKYSIKISAVETESARMYRKFFEQYHNVYGMSFCHVAFKFGIITYLGDEVAVVGFKTVI